MKQYNPYSTINIFKSIFTFVIAYFASRYFINYEQLTLTLIILCYVIFWGLNLNNEEEIDELPLQQDNLPVIGVKPVNYDEYLYELKDVPMPLKPDDQIGFDRNKLTT